MAKLYVFNMVTLDGYFEGPNHDLSWHNVDQEFADFAVQQLESTSMILFGRKTYQLMAEFWPQKEAFAEDPETARLMRDTPKVVFSRTLNSADWDNTTLINSDAVEAITELKSKADKDIAIFGSSEFCASIIPSKVIDEYRLMINPVLIGNGTTLFEGITERLTLTLDHLHQFSNGNILGYYQPNYKGGE